MNFKIEPLMTEDRSKWNNFVNNQKETSIVHTIEWKNILEEVFGYEPFYHVIKNHEGKIVGISPAFICKTFFGKILISMPFFEYGGPFVLEEYKDAYKELFKIYKELAENGRVKKIKIRTPPNLIDYSEYDVAGLGFEKAVEAEDFILDLKGKSYEKDVWNGYKRDSNIRTDIRKALKQGTKINKSHNWETLYKLIVEKDKELGSPPFPKKYFEKLEQQLRDKLSYATAYITNEEITRDVEEPEKEDYTTGQTTNMMPAASMLSITFHNRMLIHQLGSDKEYLKKCPASILWNEMIKDAMEKGLDEVDLGRSMPGSQHAHIKEQFLTKKREVYAFYYPRAEDHYKFLWVEKVFAKVPWMITRTGLGEFIIKRNP